MRSGNGRHRRPRQAPALVVAAGVTGSAIAIPLLGAGSASAADTATWERVADCESGGMWSADLGNGYYGGLQLSQDTWEEFGGTAHAPRPDLASRSQQIAVAEKVLAAQGPTAWPSCALLTGLVVDEAKDRAKAGTGLAPSATAEAQGDEAEPVDPPTFGDGADASTPPSPSGSPAPAQSSDPAAAPSAAGSTASGSDSGATDGAEAGGSGKHRGTPADEAGEPSKSVDSGNSGNDRESGRHASRGDGSARDAAAAEDEYTVRPGDNLWAIADANEVPGGWPALYEANEETVGSDPDLILPGQSLDLGLEQGQLTE
ncbi:transglycosylase family protein [Streptomyces formicae]|uniref:LysM peptidoglycan-binding domain-containing protein n=1 Tax=Streptomyces formicae TaxID=1616117 RepID=A0ABY3WYF9_9ACTN|nr:transglycosylase family protein [Streptomyces formicae]UNM15575.1 LysM peptidoglycan-binding domain-containing protein [Streptomyces formicae]